MVCPPVLQTSYPSIPPNNDAGPNPPTTPRKRGLRAFGREEDGQTGEDNREEGEEGEAADQSVLGLYVPTVIQYNAGTRARRLTNRRHVDLRGLRRNHIRTATDDGLWGFRVVLDGEERKRKRSLISHLHSGRFGSRSLY